MSTQPEGNRAQPVQGPLEPREVNLLHARSDVDNSSVAQHHTLGMDPNQASPGHHTHNGRNSKRLLEDDVISGARDDATTAGALNELLELLEARFGLTNNSSET